MRKHTDKIPSALTHGAYSGFDILPGEDREASKKSQQELIAEYTPSGPHEEDIVDTIARQLWRKQNLLIYRLTKLVRDRA